MSLPRGGRKPYGMQAMRPRFSEVGSPSSRPVQVSGSSMQGQRSLDGCRCNVL
uniref:Uncharacterized protein n=1 Tax=Arundo donax TaxID=35708 RepID=A0A0A9G5S7_ARUDO